MTVLCAYLSFFLRNFNITSSPWYDLLPRYLVLVIGFLGASLATHRKEHINLDIIRQFLPPEICHIFAFISDLIASVICVFLLYSIWGLIKIEYSEGSRILNFFPIWIPQLFILWGFLFSGIRFFLHALKTFWWSIFLLPLLVGMIVVSSESYPDLVYYGGFAGILVGLISGTPLFAILMGSTLIFFWYDDVSLFAVSGAVLKLSASPALVALPLFTMMGSILSNSNSPQRLVKIARTCLGWIPGGLAVATVIVCAFFTTFTGASGVTILALGGLFYQLLRKENYSENLTVGLITSSGSIGLLFAPALPLILYGIVAKVDIDHMFIGGIVPGIILVVFIGVTAVFLSRKEDHILSSFVKEDAIDAIKDGIWELLLPVIILGSIISGFATVVEVSAVGVVYTVIVIFFIKKDISFTKDLYKITCDSGILIGSVLIILASALAFTDYLVDAEIPQTIIDISRKYIKSKWLFLLGVNILLIFVGMILDIFSAIIIFVPILAPLAESFNVHPVHLGIIFLANLELGYLTPPVGMNLFLSSLSFKKTLHKVWITIIPFLIALIIAVFLITYIPELSLVFLEFLAS